MGLAAARAKQLVFVGVGADPHAGPAASVFSGDCGTRISGPEMYHTRCFCQPMSGLARSERRMILSGKVRRCPRPRQSGSSHRPLRPGVGRTACMTGGCVSLGAPSRCDARRDEGNSSTLRWSARASAPPRQGLNPRASASSRSQQPTGHDGRGPVPRPQWQSGERGAGPYPPASTVELSPCSRPRGWCRPPMPAPHGSPTQSAARPPHQPGRIREQSRTLRDCCRL